MKDEKSMVTHLNMSSSIKIEPDDTESFGTAIANGCKNENLDTSNDKALKTPHADWTLRVKGHLHKSRSDQGSEKMKPRQIDNNPCELKQMIHKSKHEKDG